MSLSKDMAVSKLSFWNYKIEQQVSLVSWKAWSSEVEKCGFTFQKTRFADLTFRVFYFLSLYSVPGLDEIMNMGRFQNSYTAGDCKRVFSEGFTLQYEHKVKKF